MSSIDALTIEPSDRAALSASVLDAALQEVRAKGARPDILIAGVPAAEPSLRNGLEAAYRELARYAKTLDDRVGLVDRANSVRPWTRQ
jgi:serine/threonine-protein kinase PknG